MSVLTRRRPRTADDQLRDLSLNGLIEQLVYMGQSYGLTPQMTYNGSESVTMLGETGAYTGNGVVFAASQKRINLFSEASFVFRRRGASARPTAADIFTSAELAPLDQPSKLLARMDLDAITAGNAFVVKALDGSLRPLVPWWCTIVLGSNYATKPEDVQYAWDATPVGLQYLPPGGELEQFEWSEVAHYAPALDPDARFRGMSCLRPVLRPTANADAYERFISKFWANNATPNMILTFPPDKTADTVREYVKLFQEGHGGLANAFKTAGIGGGADAKVVGANLGDLAFKEVSAHHFALICAAIGVPPVVVSIVPGLEQSSTYANYASALRSHADLDVRPRWRQVAYELGKLVKPPRGGAAELWYDVSGVSALQEDAKDDAEIAQQHAATMRTLIEAGYEPDTVTLAVNTGDYTKLVHTGLVSVQLNLPGASPSSSPALPSGPPPPVALPPAATPSAA